MGAQVTLDHLANQEHKELKVRKVNRVARGLLVPLDNRDLKVHQEIVVYQDFQDPSEQLVPVAYAAQP